MIAEAGNMDGCVVVRPDRISFRREERTHPDSDTHGLTCAEGQMRLQDLAVGASACVVRPQDASFQCR